MEKAISRKKREIVLMLITLSIGVSGQIMIKKGINLLGDIDFSNGLIIGFWKMFSSGYVFIGCMTYGVGVFLWIYILSKIDLSVAYPFFGLSYVLIMLFSWIFLGETISMIRMIGVIIIFSGVLMIAKS